MVTGAGMLVNIREVGGGDEGEEIAASEFK